MLISLRPAAAHADRVPAATAASTAAAAPAPAPTVVIGIPGLMWSDLGEHRTPTLWRLTGEGGAGGLSVRTTRPSTCPMDGWLTLSAGQRARMANGNCGLPSAPVLPGQPVSGGVAPPEGGAVAPGWQMIKNDNAHTSYHAQVGLLGDAVHKARMCTTAVGPGAVFGLADGSGKVDHYVASPDKATAADWTRCGLTAVEIDGLFRTFVSAGVDPKGDQVPVPRKKRLAAAAAADQQVAKVLAGLPSNAVVLIAGLSDVKPQAHLRVAIAKGTPFKPGYLTSSATRQDGLVTLTDLTATALQLLNLPQPEQAVGSPWDAKASDASTADKVETLREQDVAAQAVRRVQGSFFLVLGSTQLVLYGIAALALRRRWKGQGTRLRILNGTRFVALFWGAIPCASFLAGLVPWWQVPHPIPVLIVTVLGFGALIASVSLAGPWRGSVTTPGLVIAAITATVLALDVMTGSNLQINTLLGYTAIVAGRFYGFGNQAFALFAVAAILTAAWLAEYPLRQGRKDLAIALVAVIGVAAVAIDGLPAWGADFGGVLALVPTFAMLGLMISGRRVSLVKVGLFGLAGVVLVLAISYWNARSAHPTHLGRFWQDLVNGDAWGTVTRKFDSMIGSLGFWPFTVPLAGAIIFLYFVLMRPTRWRASLLDRAYAHSDTTRPALVCSLTVGIIGTLVNDSGVVILAVAFSLAIPLVLAATVRALELDAPGGGTPGSARPEPRSAPTG
ncbi:hypothetical protein J4573_19690 [Actinomadura barringtoniae]|uniref:Uncharacterized protein n=1 Tax=Actinomadura barringtoniae TaxID=1427535 RepID=A0A939T4D8_9ACTN|nr:hypothetical protein [Actinomadura barringtoniae]